MNKELGTNIKDSIRENGWQCSFLQEEQVSSLISRLAKKFSFDLSRKYLWEDISVREVFFYEADDSYWELLSSILLKNFDNQVYMAITDDEFYPWEVLTCKASNVISILQEHPYFEFFIFDKSLKKMLFDTHENKILLTY